MIKRERPQKIINLCDEYGVTSVKLIQEALSVSNIIIGRNLKELADSKQLFRVHDGAKSLNHENQLVGTTQLSKSFLILKRNKLV